MIWELKILNQELQTWLQMWIESEWLKILIKHVTYMNGFISRQYVALVDMYN